MDNFVINYGLILIGLIITVAISLFINYSYYKYSKKRTERGMIGYEVARYILDKNGLYDIDVVKISGDLTEHYDPKRKVIRLSNFVYENYTIASVAVAAHECGHAIQDKDNYKYLRIRNKIIPTINFSSQLGYLAIIIGIFGGIKEIIWIGILLELFIVLFQIITLPVEVNASKRALNELDYSHILNSEELSKSKTMLIAAILTYVVSVLTSILQILRLSLLFERGED